MAVGRKLLTVVLIQTAMAGVCFADAYDSVSWRWNGWNQSARSGSNGFSLPYSLLSSVPYTPPSPAAWNIPAPTVTPTAIYTRPEAESQASPVASPVVRVVSPAVVPTPTPAVAAPISYSLPAAASASPELRDHFYKLGHRDVGCKLERRANLQCLPQYGCRNIRFREVGYQRRCSALVPEPCRCKALWRCPNPRPAASIHPNGPGSRRVHLSQQWTGCEPDHKPKWQCSTHSERSFWDLQPGRSLGHRYDNGWPERLLIH